jgi:hypothetical protein
MKGDLPSGSHITVRHDHVRVPSVSQRPVEKVAQLTRVQVFRPSSGFQQPENVALLRCTSFGQVVGVPAAHVENDGVIVLDVRSIGRSFALPDGTTPFAEGVAANSQPEIRDTPILKSKLRFY